MTMPATGVLEVRTTGSDSSGGGFNSARGGTDRSQSDTPFKNGTNITVDAATNTDCLPDGYTPDATLDPGNYVNISAGAGFTPGIYEITAVISGKWRLDRSPAAINTAGGTWAMGGALASPGKAGSAHVGGNIIWVKSGTYPITSASTNVAGGGVSLAAGTAAARTRLMGYGSARADGGAKPLLQASAITSFVIVVMANATHLENVSLDGALAVTSRGVSGGGTLIHCYRVKVANCTNNAVTLSSGSATCLLCEYTGCTTQPAVSGGTHIFCVAHDNSVTGFNMGTTGGHSIGCVSCNNLGASSIGFSVTNASCIGCLAYGNGSHGFSYTVGAISPIAVNCLAVNNVGYGFSATAAFDMVTYCCAGFNNSLGNVNPLLLNSVAFVTLTQDPFTLGSGNNFSLNATPGGGLSLLGMGIPGSSAALQLPGLSTLTYPDIGAAIHQDTVAGLPLSNILKYVSAMLYGLVTGARTGVESFYDPTGALAVQVVDDASGNRSQVTLY